MAVSTTGAGGEQEPAPPPQQPPQGGGGQPGGPRITSVVPRRGPSSGGTQLRILGSGLRPPQSVSVGGTQVSSWHVVSDGEVQVTTPPGVPGDAAVVVTVDGHDSTGPDEPFSYLRPPVIQSVEVGRGGILDVHGTDLTPVLGVTIRGAGAAGVHPVEGGLRVKPGPGPTGDVAVVVVTEGGASAGYTVSIPAGWTRPFVFGLATAYFAMLITLLLCYKLIGGFSEHLMDPLGPLPLSIPWTGALGAVALSMSGVIYHTVRRDWDSNFLLWHVARPILGAVFASIAYFVIAGGVLASGGTPNPSTQPAAAAQPASSPTPSSAPAESPSPSPSASPSPSPSGGSGAITGGGTTTGGGIQNLFYIVLAFIIGYREETFRTLIQRVSDVILGPGSGSDGSSGGATGAGGASAGAPGPAPGAPATPAAPAAAPTPASSASAGG